MPSYYVRNDEVLNGLGQAIPNIAVTYYVQPGLTLAPVFTGPSGGSTTNPQYTNGLGQTVAYLAPGFYTITYSGAQIQTETYADQLVGGSGSGSVATFAGTPTGTIDGTNRVFVMVNGSTPLTALPTQAEVWLNFSLIPDTGYSLSLVSGQVHITFLQQAPQPASGGSPADVIYAQGIV